MKRVFAVLFAMAGGVLALQGLAGAAAKAGSYAGTTSEKGALGLVVTAGAKSVTGFSAKDSYNGICRYTAASGGFLNFTISIPKMKVSAAGTFGESIKVEDPIFKDKATLLVSGKLSGSRATGTITWPGTVCGKYATNPNALPYNETFTAKRT